MHTQGFESLLTKRFLPRSGQGLNDVGAFSKRHSIFGIFSRCWLSFCSPSPQKPHGRAGCPDWPSWQHEFPKAAPSEGDSGDPAQRPAGPAGQQQSERYVRTASAPRAGLQHPSEVHCDAELLALFSCSFKASPSCSVDTVQAAPVQTQGQVNDENRRPQRRRSGRLSWR